MSSTNDLILLYQASSKHSNYQVLPRALQVILPSERITVKSRHEIARFEYINSILDFAGLTVVDIGGNTGFFTFEVLARGAKRVDYYEGNEAHHEFVAAAAKLLNFEKRIRTFNRYVSFQDLAFPKVDCVLLLNVLHHAGDDYAQSVLSVESAKQEIVRSLKVISRKTDWLIFQMGFNWKGDCKCPLFMHGTKGEFIRFVEKNTCQDFETLAIGIAEQHEGNIVYVDLNDRNIARNDALGEFLNRPLFILRSKKRS
jgi:SAM-dependent methyltransferase